MQEVHVWPSFPFPAIGLSFERQQGFQRPGGKIVDREDDYRRRRLNRIISPTRNDAFAMGDKTPDASVRTYADVMREQQLARERDNTLKNIADKRREEEEEAAMDRDKPTKASGLAVPAPPAPAAPAAQPAAAWVMLRACEPRPPALARGFALACGTSPPGRSPRKVYPALRPVLLARLLLAPLGRIASAVCCAQAWRGMRSVASF